MQLQIENALAWLIGLELSRQHVGISEERALEMTRNILRFGEPEPDVARVLRADLAERSK